MDWFKNMTGVSRKDDTPAEVYKDVPLPVSQEIQLTGISQQPFPVPSPPEPKTGVTTLEDKLKQMVPLKEGDCLSCKIIGVSVCFATAGYVLSHGIKSRHLYGGYKKFCWTGAYLSITAVMVSLGVGRFYDMDYVGRKSEDKKDMTIMDFATEDFEKLKQFTNETISKFSGTKPSIQDKKDS